MPLHERGNGDFPYVPKCIHCTKWEKCYPDLESKVDNADAYPCPRFRMVKYLGDLDENRVERRVHRINEYVEASGD